MKLSELKAICDKAADNPMDNYTLFYFTARTYMPLLIELAEAVFILGEHTNNFNYWRGHPPSAYGLIKLWDTLKELESEMKKTDEAIKWP